MLKLAYLEHHLRPLLSRILSPQFFTKIYIKNREQFLFSLTECLNEKLPVCLYPIEIAGLRFRNDLGNAAGFDKNADLLKFNYFMGAGFALIGTVLSRSHTGNQIKYGKKNYNPWVPLPNSSSAINSLGLPSKGIDYALDNIKRFQDEIQPENFPIGLSIIGHPLDKENKKLDGIIECVKKAQGVVNFIELNESCPNVSNHSLDELNNCLETVCEYNQLPLFIKLDNLDLNNGFIELCEGLNVDGLSLCNTQKNYSTLRLNLAKNDQKIFDYYTQNFYGGLSGKIICDYSFNLIEKVASYLRSKKSSLNLIHIGGIDSLEDVEKSRNYAQLRQWYTGFMKAITSQKLQNIYKNMLKKDFR